MLLLGKMELEKLIEDENIKRSILSNFEVLNMEEWHNKYPQYSIEAI